ncbi:MAG: SHOCT domain-containing protein [Desulfobulbaceae bacterium]
MWNCNWGFPLHGGWFFGHGPFGLLLLVLLTIVVVSLLIRLGRSIFARDASTNKDSRDSLEILRARFARGEISAEEYQRMRDILNL